MIKKIIDEIRNYPGLTRKRNIYKVTSFLQTVSDFGDTIVDFGEDAAVMHYRDEYLLLAAEGIWAGLIEANPYGAGKASVMASVNDIYAMGGRPLAMVNVLGISESKYYEEITRGIRKGCEKFCVPMVGGHLHPDTKELSLSVAILGAARKLLLSSNARQGQELVFAVDLEGRGYQCKPVISWDTNSGKNSKQVLARLEILPYLAEQGLCQTAKDVSNAGLLGTIGLLLETSGKGAHIALDGIPKPDGFPEVDWLKAFLSYGFILCTDKDKTDQVIKKFKEQSITARVIGVVTDDKKVLISYQRKEGVLFDLERESLAGHMP